MSNTTLLSALCLTGDEGANVIVDTTESRAAGKLLSIRNAGTEKFSVDFDGAITGTPTPTGGIGFYGVTPPVAQPDAIADPAGGATVDDEARAALVDVLDVLRSYGFIDT